MEVDLYDKINVKEGGFMKDKKIKGLEKLKKGFKKFLSDESGQGMTEYVFILLIIIAVLVVFREQIKTAFTDKIGDLTRQIGRFTGE